MGVLCPIYNTVEHIWRVNSLVVASGDGIIELLTTAARRTGCQSPFDVSIPLNNAHWHTSSLSVRFCGSNVLHNCSENRVDQVTNDTHCRNPQ